MPDEDFVDGARREAMEETGTEIELQKYLLRIGVRFIAAENHIDWISHIFLAEHVKGDIDPHDTREIREALLISPDQIPEFCELMRKTGVGGLNYRAFLTEEVGRILNY